MAFNFDNNYEKSVYDEWVADISLWDSAIVKMKSLSEDGLENAMVDQLLRVDLLADEIKQGIEQKNFMISASAVDGASQLHIYDDEKDNEYSMRMLWEKG